ncbi:MAG: hypothetical protein ACTHOO_09905 [Alcanivorax sp.]
MSRGEQINTTEPDSASQMPTIGLSDLGMPSGAGLNLSVSQCVEGGWITEHENGSTFDTDGMFHYTVELEFENQQKIDELLSRDDLSEIHNTMTNTITELSGLMLTWERGWDNDPDAYPDGVVPENPEKSFTDFAIEGFNEDILPEFVDIMKATYPDIGLTGATMSPGTGLETPGCYQGGPENLANTLNGDDGRAFETTESVSAKPFRM